MKRRKYMSILLTTAVSSLVATAYLATSIFAVADLWTVRYAKGAPGNQQIYNCTAAYHINYATSSINESCTSASNVADGNGFIGYAIYEGYYRCDNSTSYVYNIYSTKYHFSMQSPHNISVNTIPGNTVIYADYTVHHGDATAIFSGTYGS